MDDNLTHPGWPRFQCQPRCGLCCESGLPEITPWERPSIASFLGMTVDHLVETHLGRIIRDPDEVQRLCAEQRERDGVYAMYAPEEPPERLIVYYERKGPCPFLADDKHCRIYSVRPGACRLYPFQTTFGRGDIDCPGIDALPADGTA